jgi:hypothetical protein
LEYYLSNFENFLQPIEVELAKSEVTLESLEKRVDRPTKRLIKQILTQINDYQRTRPKNKVLLQRIHTQMKKAIEKVKDLLRNR